MSYTFSRAIWAPKFSINRSTNYKYWVPCICVTQQHIHPSILCGISFTSSVNSRCNQMRLYVHSAVLFCVALRMVFTLDVWMYATKLPQTKQDVSIKFVIGLYFLRLHASCRLWKTNLSSVYFCPWHTIYRIKHCAYIVRHCCILIIYETYWHAMIYEYVQRRTVPPAFTMQNAIIHPSALNVVSEEVRKKINF